MKQRLQLIILFPMKPPIQQEVDSVEFPGENGRFSVHPQHAPLISSLVAGNIEYCKDNTPQSIAIRSGFVEVRENKITVCAETE